MATPAEPATYWCHQCHRSVRPSTGADVVCPFCQGGFIEEIENAPGIVFPAQRIDPERREIPRTNVADGDGLPPGYHRFTAGGRNPPPIVQVLHALSAILQQGRPEEAAQFAAAADGHITEDAAMDSVDRILFGGNRLGVPGGGAGGGGNIEVFFDNGTGNARRLPANIGDYFFGPGLDQLIQHLAENDPNRYGTPPAAKSAIDAMPTITITDEHKGTDAAQCAVCKDEFEPGSQVRQMPCKHLYHGDCILPWLQQHNSCPVCRFEMPSEDAPPQGGQSSMNILQQNQQQQQQQGNAVRSRGFSIWGSPRGGFQAEMATSGSDTDTSGQAQGTSQAQTQGRRGSFQFPWPFTTFRATNAGNNSQQGGNNSQQAGGSGSGDPNNSTNNTDSITDDLLRHDLPD